MKARNLSPVANEGEPCTTCRRTAESDEELHFVPWGERMESGRLLCYSCLLTVFRLDTQALMQHRRVEQLAASQPVRMVRPVERRAGLRMAS